MPYILKVGSIFGKSYKCGEFVPGVKGELADMEAVGAVEWVDSPPREQRPKAPPKTTAKRRAVK